MKRLLSVCLAVCLLAAAIPAVSMAETKYGVVHGGWLRLRAAASFDAATISSYYTGTTVTILGTTGSWYSVQAPDGRTGYMYSAYLTVGGGGGGGGGGGTGTATVWSSNGYGVRLRTGPGTGYRVIGVYSVGTRATVLERGSYWSRIQIGGAVGYMMNQFLTGGGIPVPDPSPTGNATVWSSNGYGVRLRTGPGKGYGIIGVYSVGTRVTVLEKGPVWDKIMVGSRVGYMMNEFLIYYANNEVTNVTLNITKPVVGDVLSVRTITPPGASVSYSWLVGGKEKGTAPTYTVLSADEGKKIKLKVTGRNGYTGSAVSAETEKVITATTLTGVTLNMDMSDAPVVGDVLKAKSITPKGATVTYAWVVGGVQVSTKSTYTVQSDDVGKKIQLFVTGTGAYTGTVSTAKTLKVVKTADVVDAFIYLGSSKLVGAPNVGDTLTAVPKPANATVKYTWYVDDQPTWLENGKQTSNSGPTFEVKDAHKGKMISVKLTGVSPYKKSATSLKVGPVTGLVRIESVDLKYTSPLVYQDGVATVISATVKPAGLSGKVLYDWKRDGQSVGSGETYTLTEYDVGGRITVTVSGDGTNSAGGKTSSKSDLVTGIVTSVALSLDPVTGIITATTVPAGAKDHVNYAWYRDNLNTTPLGATGNTYQTVGLDEGKDIWVKITAKSSGLYTCKNGSVTMKIPVPATPDFDISNLSLGYIDPPTNAFKVTGFGKVPANVTFDYLWEDCPAHVDLAPGEKLQETYSLKEVSSTPFTAKVTIGVYVDGVWTQGTTLTCPYTPGAPVTPNFDIANLSLGYFKLPANAFKVVGFGQVPANVTFDYLWEDCPPHVDLAAGEKLQETYSLKAVPATAFTAKVTIGVYVDNVWTQGTTLTYAFNPAVDPIMAIIDPPVGAIQPSMDTAQPPEDSGEPSVDVVEPPADAGEPSGDAVNPPVDAENPPIDAGNPPVDSGEPTVNDEYQPPVDSGPAPAADVGASPASAPVSNAISSVTLNTYDPAVGTALSVTVNPSGAAASYQWLKDGYAIYDATTSIYVVQASDVNGKISVMVWSGSGASVESDKTNPVTNGSGSDSSTTTSEVYHTDAVQYPSFEGGESWESPGFPNEGEW